MSSEDPRIAVVNDILDSIILVGADYTPEEVLRLIDAAGAVQDTQQ